MSSFVPSPEDKGLVHAVVPMRFAASALGLETPTLRARFTRGVFPRCFLLRTEHDGIMVDLQGLVEHLRSRRLEKLPGMGVTA